MGWKIKVPKIRLPSVSQAWGIGALGNTMYGMVAGNTIDKEFGVTPGLKASAEGGVADADRTKKNQEEMEARRRSFLGLMTSGSRGVTNPLNPQRSRLGGF